MATAVPISALPSATSTAALTFPANEAGVTSKALTGTGANTVPYNDASGILVANLDLGGTVTGILPLNHGGTNANLSPSSGGIVYSTPFAFGIVAGTTTANQVLLSGSVSAPSWSTAVYPTTTTINQLLYSPTADTISGLATANSGVLITSAGGVPSIATTLPTTVQGNITAIGTVTSGIWHGSVIDPTYGGTGVNNGSSTLTLAGSFATSGAFAVTQTYTGVTNVTFPTSGTLATTASIPTLPISLANGGTNASLTASNGGIFYSTATAAAILAGNATANKMLLSGSSAAPTWSTSTIPTSAGATANKVLLSNGTNYVLSTPTFSNTPGTAGKVMISDGTNWISSTPTFPNASATTGKIIRSDGTNWQTSTSTIPDTFVQGDIVYASATNTLTALAKNTTATRYLANTGTTNNPNWDQINLTNGVTGLLPIANIPTGTSSTTVTIGNDVRLAPTPSGAGKMLYDTGSAYTELVAGTTSQVLIGGAAPSFANVPMPSNIGIGYQWLAPATTATTGLCTALAANNASNTASGLVNPDVYRQIQLTLGVGWDGGTAIVTGTDATGATVTVQRSIAGTTLSLDPFMTITSITKSTVGASAATLTVGPGGYLGVPTQHRLMQSYGIVYVNNVLDSIALTSLASGSDQLFNFTTQPNGSRNFIFTGFLA